MEGGELIKFETLLAYYEDDGTRTPEQHNKTLAQYGIKRDDMVHFNFDVVISTVPWPSKGQP
jgi:hypothetical protein